MRYSIAVILWLWVVGNGWSQIGENSPLSSMGLGDIPSPGLVAGNSLSGLSGTYYNGYNPNIVNPASYAGMMATAFDVGFDISRIAIQDQKSKQNSWGGNLKYLSLTMPLISPVNVALDRKEQNFKMGLNVALLPVSKMDYRINQSSTTDEDIKLTRQYGGRGGLNKLQFGTGAQYKNFSAGFNIGVLFGSVKNEKSLLFEESLNSHHTYSLDERAYHGLIWNAGLLYRYYIKKDAEDNRKNRFLSFGLYGNSDQPVTFDQKIMTLRKAGSYSGLDDGNPSLSTLDTVSLIHDKKLKNKLPSEVGFGISYSSGNQLQIGANFSAKNWTNFNNNLNIGNLRNSWSSAASIEYTPNPNSLLNYWNRVSYRSTIYYDQDPRVNKDGGLDEIGLKVGVGLPIFEQRQLSYFNMSLDFGELSNKMFKENFVRINFGITLNNNLWFYKRRFE